MPKNDFIIMIIVIFFRSGDDFHARGVMELNTLRVGHIFFFFHYDFISFSLLPGNGSKEPETLQPYLEVLVDEILSLTGKELFDAYKQAPFTLTVDVLSYVLDYPGVGKVFNVLGSGAYRGCAWCEIQDKCHLK